MGSHLLIEAVIVAGSLLMLDLYDGHHPAPTLGGIPLAAALIMVMATLGVLACLIPGIFGVGLTLLAAAALLLLPVEGLMRFAGFDPALYGQDRRFLASVLHTMFHYRITGPRTPTVRD